MDINEKKKISRKEFLKLGSIATIFAAGGSSAVGLYASGSESAETDPTKTRWGLVIDSKKCKPGCTDCIDACHFEHNVPNHSDKKHEIKWIWKEPAKNLFSEFDYQLNQTYDKNHPLLTLCNHCKNPPCVKVCPTQATFKRESDGIVMMDYHRCIGCRFCMAGCPYGSRSFNYKDPRKGLTALNPAYPTRTTGVVEKCNFCSEIVGKGDLPHCVTNCNEGAITFGNLNDPESEVRKILAKHPSHRRKAELGTEPSVFYLT